MAFVELFYLFAFIIEPLFFRYSALFVDLVIKLLYLVEPLFCFLLSDIIGSISSVIHGCFACLFFFGRISLADCRLHMKLLQVFSTDSSTLFNDLQFLHLGLHNNCEMLHYTHQQYPFSVYLHQYPSFDLLLIFCSSV